MLTHSWAMPLKEFISLLHRDSIAKVPGWHLCQQWLSAFILFSSSEELLLSHSRKKIPGKCIHLHLFNERSFPERKRRFAFLPCSSSVSFCQKLMSNTPNNDWSQGESHSAEQGGVPTKPQSQVENLEVKCASLGSTEQKLHFPWAYRTFNNLNNNVCIPSH